MEKGKVKKSLILVICLGFLASCSTEKFQNKGSILPQSGGTKLNFTTNRTIIVLPVVIDGVSKNFLLDTGAEFNVIHVDKVTGKTTKVNGADGKKVKVGVGTIGSLKISETEFKDTYTWKLPMDYLVQQVPNFGGLIGQSIISKANWLINYSKNTIEFTDKDIETLGFESFSMKNVRDPHINLNIEGEVHSALIDLGSSSTLTIPKGSALAEKLLKNYTFTDNQRESFKASGVQIVN